MTKYLIVNSDDYGISEGVSRGILEAHHKGIVTSTSTMVNMPYAAEAIATAQETAPQLGLGLHLVLSFGKPISPPETVPSLVTETGTFVSTFNEMLAKLPTFSVDDLRTELNAQYDHFVALAGTKPDHIDCHHGTTYFRPEAYDIMMTIADKHDLPYRRPIWLDEPLNAEFEGQEATVAELRKVHTKYTHLKCPDERTEGTFFWDRRSRLPSLKQTIANIREGYTELICHVGYGADLKEDYHIQREDELAAYTHPDIVKMVKNNPEFELIRFSDLPA